MRRKRDQYTSPETSAIREEIQKALKGDVESTLDVMDALIRALQKNKLYIAHQVVTSAG